MLLTIHVPDIGFPNKHILLYRTLNKNNVLPFRIQLKSDLNDEISKRTDLTNEGAAAIEAVKNNT